MNNWRDAYIDANGIRIHYYRTGGVKPQVILNHGAMDDGLCWTRVAKELEGDYDVVMFDARGHGYSDSGQGDYTSKTRAKDLAAAIEALGLDKPVVGGHSMGADTSLHLAAMFPGQTRAIFLEDPPISKPGEPMFGGEMGSKGDDVLKLFLRIMKLIRILPLFLGKPLARKMMPISPDDEIIPWLKSKKRVNSDFYSSMNSPEFVDPFPTAVLEKVRIPTLLIIGDREKGAIVSQEVASKMAESIPSLRTAHLEGANHDIRRAKFNQYMTALKSFLVEIYA
jgi:N-formylmaleamate deformylase